MKDTTLLEDLKRHHSVALLTGRVTFYKRAINAIEELLVENRALRILAADAVLLAEHGDYSNGNAEYGMDEGMHMAAIAIADLRDRAESIGVQVGATLDENKEIQRED